LIIFVGFGPNFQSDPIFRHQFLKISFIILFFVFLICLKLSREGLSSKFCDDFWIIVKLEKICHGLGAITIIFRIRCQCLNLKFVEPRVPVFWLAKGHGNMN